MSLLVDTHAHLDFPEFAADLAEVLKKARQAGVGAIINVGTGERSSRQVVSLSDRDPCLWAAVGVHPHYAGRVSPGYRRELAELAAHPRVVAIGETGLDYYRNFSSPADQEEVFRYHLSLAAETGKPVIIHSRNAYDETLKILREFALPPRPGVMHCFSGGRVQARAFLELGFYLSVAGPVTYPRSHELREILKEIPGDRLLLETDAPYLSPQPYRGLRNEPAFIKATYERVALALETDFERLAEQVRANSACLFAGTVIL
jgi:TatD DNase family protein